MIVLAARISPPLFRFLSFPLTAGSLYLRNLYGVATNKFREDTQAMIEQNENEFNIITAAFLAAFGLLCIAYYYPLFREVDDDLRDCRAMLHVFPPDVLLDCTPLHDFLASSHLQQNRDKSKDL